MKDSCFVCKSMMSPYFTKDFAGKWGLGIADYWRCGACGLVVSKTHLDMSPEEWRELHLRYYSSFVGTEYLDDDPRRLSRLRSQAATIVGLTMAGILPRDLPWVDFGCGDGKLADFLGEYGLLALKFDRYMASQSEAYLTEEQLATLKYSLVINTSVFEHLRSIDTLDENAGLVAESGVLALHTLVRESIPNDPTWFYLLPVHCTFFTNRSMQILFDRWKFEASIYHLESRIWFMFRQNAVSAKSFVEREGRTPGDEYYFKKGFMDYWK
jgi:hypothetical protein